MSDSRLQIERLVYLYAEFIDAGDFAAVGELFARASFKASGQVVARNDAGAVRGMYERTTRRYDDGTPHTKHVVTNLVVEIEDTECEASARSYFTVFQALADFPLQAVIAGRYRDRFACENGVWRFSEREIVPDLYGDLSRHLLIDLPRPVS